MNLARLKAAVDPIARRFGYYTAYTISHDEYIGSLGKDCDLDDSRQYLFRNGYRANYLSAAKRHPETGQLHDLSYRRVPSAMPPEAVDTRLADWRPDQLQYHVHVFRVGSYSELYSHLELRPDFTCPRPNPRRLREHYRPEITSTYLRGATDLDSR